MLYYVLKYQCTYQCFFNLKNSVMGGGVLGLKSQSSPSFFNCVGSKPCTHIDDNYVSLSET